MKAGQEFTIKVPYSGTPKPTAKWTQNGADVSDAPRVTMTVISLSVMFNVDVHRKIILKMLVITGSQCLLGRSSIEFCWSQKEIEFIK